MLAVPQYLLPAGEFAGPSADPQTSRHRYGKYRGAVAAGALASESRRPPRLVQLARRADSSLCRVHILILSACEISPPLPEASIDTVQTSITQPREIAANSSLKDTHRLPIALPYPTFRHDGHVRRNPRLLRKAAVRLTQQPGSPPPSSAPSSSACKSARSKSLWAFVFLPSLTSASFPSVAADSTRLLSLSPGFWWSRRALLCLVRRRLHLQGALLARERLHQPLRPQVDGDTAARQRSVPRAQRSDCAANAEQIDRPGAVWRAGGVSARR